MKSTQIEQIIEDRKRAIPEAFELRRQNRLLREKVEYLEILRFVDWLTQAQAARVLGVHRGQICRAVKRGKLETNGLTGWLCRINPQSLVKCDDRRETEAQEKLRRQPGSE
jgi:predicted DNA-binding protein (UPF0251 family)